MKKDRFSHLRIFGRVNDPSWSKYRGAEWIVNLWLAKMACRDNFKITLSIE